MNYLNILDCDIADGEGIRVALYVSGCPHKCKGCHNPESWDQNAGKQFTEETKQKLFSLIDRSYIDGLTLTGGDPLFPINLPYLTSLCKQFKEKFPSKTIWCYTGYTYEQVKDLPIMNYIDVLVDGPYIKELRDITLPFRGSSNQDIIQINHGS